MKARNRALLAALALGLGLATSVTAQGGPVKVKEEKPGLLKLAKVTPADAQKTAQAKYPSAKIVSGEIEKEDGKLIFSFDIQQTGVKGIEEVTVDALTGLVVKTEHEDPAAEAKEKAAERAKAKPKPKVKKPAAP
jgi:hypothetical protein